ncbi:MAG: hypothetical protein E6K54_00080 [Gammaproteobacteria bacterium]|nr:MAG: hypothetical protein E6K54_00080 [Gammaproteobacteria bacterium]
MSLVEKLSGLEVSRAQDKKSIGDLTDPNGYKILSLTLKSGAKHGPVIMAEVEAASGEKMVTFLPQRFTKNLGEEDIATLGGGGYYLRCTGKTGASFNVSIFKK